MMTGGVERVLPTLPAPLVRRCGGHWHRPGAGHDRDQARIDVPALHFARHRAQRALFIAERLAASGRTVGADEAVAYLGVRRWV